MQLLFILISILSFAAIAGWVWLVVAGFRRSAVWGVVNVLFPPISLIVFAVKYWDEARKPFLLYMGSSVVGVIVALIAVPLAVGAAAGEMEADFEKLAAQAELEAADVRLGDEPAAPQPAAEVVSEPVPEPTVADTLAAVMLEDAAPDTVTVDRYDYLPDPAPTGFRSIRVRDASRFLGDYVRFVDRNGGEHDGRLKSVEGNTIVFERHLTAGTFVFEYRRGEIENLYVAY